MQVQVAQKLAVAQTDLEACDRLIRKCDSRINPEEIEQISAWKGRYGKRGALKTFLSEGLVERIDAPKTEWGGPTGKWRWMTGPKASLNELRFSAVAAGMEVKQAKRRGRRPAKQKPAQALPAV
jgi:hypothetical protein